MPARAKLFTSTSPAATGDLSTYKQRTDLIELMGFNWSYDPNYDVTHAFDSTGKLRRVQIREVKHLAPAHNVEQFSAQMGEVVFPPMVVTQDGVVVDGNTTAAAKRKRKDKFHHAFILDVEWTTASPKRKHEMWALGAALNQLGGERLVNKELRQAVTECLALDFKADVITRLLGAKPAIIVQIKRETAALAKLAKVGLDRDDIKVALRHLGVERVVGLNDVPFRELALLASDAGFHAKEISEIAKALTDLGSDAAALEHLVKLRAESEERIRQNRLTGNGKMSPPAVLRQRLGYILNHTKNPDTLVEHRSELMVDHLNKVEQTMVVLEALAQLQRDRIDEVQETE